VGAEGLFLRRSGQIRNLAGGGHCSSDRCFLLSGRPQPWQQARHRFGACPSYRGGGDNANLAGFLGHWRLRGHIIPPTWRWRLVARRMVAVRGSGPARATRRARVARRSGRDPQCDTVLEPATLTRCRAAAAPARHANSRYRKVRRRASLRVRGGLYCGRRARGGGDAMCAMPGASSEGVATRASGETAIVRRSLRRMQGSDEESFRAAWDASSTLQADPPRENVAIQGCPARPADVWELSWRCCGDEQPHVSPRGSALARPTRGADRSRSGRYA